MLEFSQEDISAERIERLRQTYEPLTRSVRELIDATIRTEVDADTIVEVTAEIDAATARLRRRQLPGPFGVRYNFDGASMAWGNVAIGVRAEPDRTAAGDSARRVGQGVDGITVEAEGVFIVPKWAR